MKNLLFKRHWILWISAFSFLGCASYQSKISKAHQLISSGDYGGAATQLEKQVEEHQGDKLVYLLEYATALHLAGQYADSNAAFEKADKLCDLNDYLSLSRETGAMIVQEGLTQYKADTYEFLLINVYQALNYLLLGDIENAQVKARRLNEKINKIELGKENKKQQVSFAAYLAAMLLEARGDWDNAYILYRKAYDLNPELEAFQRALLISAKMARREEVVSKYKKQYADVYQQINWEKLKQQGEVVVIFQQGWISRKRPQRMNQILPELVSVPPLTRSASLEVGDKNYPAKLLYDLDAVSRQSLADELPKLTARALARRASRIAMRETSRNNQKNDGLAAVALASIILDVTDVADLRQWSTLPSSFQIVRVMLEPDNYNLKIIGDSMATPLWQGEATVKKGRKFIHTLRYF